jgi:hypothetical protein
MPLTYTHFGEYYLLFKDGVWSAFEHHYAGCYDLPFTGFILIPIGANLLRIYY